MAQPKTDFSDVLIFKDTTELPVGGYKRKDLERALDQADGQYDPMEFGLYLKHQYLANLGATTKREIASDLAVDAELALKPRGIGLAATNDKHGEAMWFDEVTIYRKPGTKGTSHHDFYHWWDPRNVPPTDTKGEKYKEGIDFHIVELPLLESQLVSEEDLEAFGGSETEFRKVAWEKAASNYVGQVIYKMERGDSEKWALTLEPALFLNQKPGLEGKDKELATPDRSEWFLDEAKNALAEERENLEAELLKAQRAGATFTSIEELPEEKLKMFQYYKDVIGRIVRAQGMRNDPLYLGKNWREQTVSSNFRLFHSVGRLMFARLPSPLAVALEKTRRIQPRMMRIIGIEMSADDGGVNINPEHIHYERMSIAWDLNPRLTNAMIEKVGMLPAIQKEVLRRLNEYRALHGQLPCNYNPSVGGAKGEQSAGTKKKKESDDPNNPDDDDSGGDGDDEKKKKKDSGPSAQDRLIEQERREKIQLKAPPRNIPPEQWADRWNDLTDGQKLKRWMNYFEKENIDPEGDEASKELEKQKKFWIDHADDAAVGGRPPAGGPRGGGGGGAGRRGRGTI